MAWTIGRAHVVKAAFLAGFLLILLNLLGPKWDTRIDKLHFKSNQWPKRSHSTTEINFISSTPISGRNESIIIEDSTMQSSIVSETSNNKTKSIEQNRTENEREKEDNESGFATSTVVLLTTLDEYDNEKEKEGEENGSSISTVIEAVRFSSTTPSFPRTSLQFYAAVMQQLGLHPCPEISKDLLGPLEVDTLYEPLVEIERRLGPKVLNGGWWRPRVCNARYRVAIIVPYRDREQHLPIFLKNLHPFLQRQQLDYGIFVVEQSPGREFNRAKLMNVGFVEALRMYNWDCFVFHDVDLLPMDDRNVYGCPTQPRHLSVAVDTFGFKLPYSGIFGGVSALTVDQFRRVNGFSNLFWGWGGEDDDMSNRLKHYKLEITRYPAYIAKYTMLTHKKEKASPKRFEKLFSGMKRMERDGLNSLTYHILAVKKFPLYTWIHVNIDENSPSLFFSSSFSLFGGSSTFQSDSRIILILAVKFLVQFKFCC